MFILNDFKIIKPTLNGRTVLKINVPNLFEINEYQQKIQTLI